MNFKLFAKAITATFNRMLSTVFTWPQRKPAPARTETADNTHFLAAPHADFQRGSVRLALTFGGVRHAPD